MRDHSDFAVQFANNVRILGSYWLPSFHQAFFDDLTVFNQPDKRDQHRFLKLPTALNGNTKFKSCLLKIVKVFKEFWVLTGFQAFMKPFFLMTSLFLISQTKYLRYLDNPVCHNLSVVHDSAIVLIVTFTTKSKPNHDTKKKSRPIYLYILPRR